MLGSPEILRTLDEKTAVDHTALVIIDMCNDFVHPQGKTAVHAGRDTTSSGAIVPALVQLRDAAHSVGVPVIHIQHSTLPGNVSDSGPWLEARSRAEKSVVDICIAGTWGQQIVDELAPIEGEIVVQKNRYGGFLGTNLDLILRSNGIRSIVVVGVSTNSCVEATAREAFALDYYVVLVADGCASWDMGLHEATLQSAEGRYATIAESHDVIDGWKSMPKGYR